MKKLICLILALVMLTALTACGGKPVTLPAEGGKPVVTGDSAPAPAADAADAAAAENTVTVSTVDELLAAIAPDTTVVLTAGVYDLTAASDYGAAESTYYVWEGIFDPQTERTDTSFELVIRGVSGLTIAAAEDADVTIETVPRYANVVTLRDCTGASLRGVTIGHTEEPGVCSGGVVKLERARDISIDGCSLFGCGTVGIQAYDSRNVYAADSVIFDCSDSAVVSSGSSDIRIDSCEIYHCGLAGWSGIFCTDTTTGFAVLNSRICDCTGSVLLSSTYSHGAYILGCTVNGSTAFDSALFAVTGENIIIDDSSFDDGLYYPLLYSEYSDGTAVRLNGDTVTDDVLKSMEQSAAVYSGPAKTPAPELDITVNADGISEVHVSTVDELLAAIAPDTVIYLDEQLYDLSTASAYGGAGGDWYVWQDDFDGPGLVISGVDNLTLISENGATISAIPRYADVLSFQSCTNITLSGFTAGHTEEPGSCSGGVLSFSGCTSISVDGCRLYGCGVIGVNAQDSRNIRLTDTEIYDCSYCAIRLYASSEVSVENCNIHDCGRPEIILTDSSLDYNGEKLTSGAYYVTADGTERDREENKF